MRSINEVSNYINSKGYCDKPFDYAPAVAQVVETLKSGEEIIFACATSALVNGAYTFKHGVIAITNERMVYAVKSNALFARNLIVKSISLDFVSDVTKTVLKAYGIGNMAFDCRNEQFNYVVSLFVFVSLTLYGLIIPEGVSNTWEGLEIFLSFFKKFFLALMDR